MYSKNNPFVTPLYEGTFSVGLDKKFFPIEKDAPPAKGALKLSINPFLIKTGERNILFDSGLGDLGENTSTALIKKNLSAYDLTELDITDIFISHLHYDHIGGLAGWSSGYLELTFPAARLWVSGNGWNNLLGKEGSTDQETRLDLVHFLNAKADLHFLGEEDQPVPGIRVKEMGGHTEFSLALFYEAGDSRYMMAGDVIGRKSAVRQKFTAKFDFDPEKSMKLRESLKKTAFEKGYVIMAYHESDTPLFRIGHHDQKHGYLTENAAERYPS
ncbi:MAG: MBL fold metallo-hydrolase [Balneolaceae bacterium]